MELKTFRSLFAKHPAIDATANQLQYSESKVHWKGVANSARALFATQLSAQVPGHHLFVLQDKEEAAYFFNDVESLFPDEKNSVFYPASYRSAYHFEETDNANVVARAEVLEKINNGTNAWIVTYPQALFEKVPTQQKLTENTLKVQKGQKYSLDFMNELLLDYGFERVDFVYEPGQFAIRGGILDVFSFANDYPFRMEFFGEELESIRTFDPVDQLSIANHDFFHIVPNVQKQFIQHGLDTFLGFLGKNATVWISSMGEIIHQLDKEYEKAVKAYDGLNHATIKHSLPGEIYTHKTEWTQQIQGYNVVEWGPEFHFKAGFEASFQVHQQPTFNKNFEMLRDDLIAHKKAGFTNLFFSNQPKQIDRLYSIFEDIGGEVEFIPMPIALHEGFILPDLKLVCYTDHQVFERYHRFKLKEGFSQAKQAIT